MKKKLTITFFLICYYSIIFGSVSVEVDGISKQHPIYKGVSIIIPRDTIKVLRSKYEKHLSYHKAAGIMMINNQDILDGLISSFTNMVTSFNSNETNLPSCLSLALQCYFDKLRKPEENDERLVIIWNIRADFYQSIYDQNGCGGAQWPPRQDKKIFVYDIYKSIFTSITKSGNTEYKKQILTSSVIFHELLHMIRWKYSPSCLRSYIGDIKTIVENGDYSLEEAIAEDGTWAVFGKKYTSQYYEEIRGYPRCNNCDKSKNDCTGKNVCKGCCEKCEDFRDHDDLI